ncbi:ribosomal protein S21 [Rhizobium halophytocola]|uniref:Small ribosomal subunit protein bS21 n=1 Tax=Rhizobium halophytocola TaxID=735519 RepID=A0ABS4DZG3_9HYPH|nr:ribosomal protein S21 [Rhizobium halophytocola]
MHSLVRRQADMAISVSSALAIWIRAAPEASRIDIRTSRNCRNNACSALTKPSSDASRFRDVDARPQHAADLAIHAGPSSVQSGNREGSPSPTTSGLAAQGDVLQVIVRDNNVDQALRVLKKKMQREGVFREMKARRAFEKPSEKRAREKADAIRRARKLARKKMQREGLLPAPKKKVFTRGAGAGAGTGTGGPAR